MFALYLPSAMLITELTRSLNVAETNEMRSRWAFVELSPGRLISFSPHPPGSLPLRNHRQHQEFSWSDASQRDGKPTEDLAKELARRSLEVVCLQKGLKYCDDRKVFYFPESVTFSSARGTQATALALQIWAVGSAMARVVSSIFHLREIDKLCVPCSVFVHEGGKI